MIRHKINGNDVDEMQAKINDLLAEYAESNDPDIEQKLIKEYEKLTKFKKGCGVCIAGRAHFIKSLGQLKNGDAEDALKSMKASVKSVGVKLDILLGKFKGK